MSRTPGWRNTLLGKLNRCEFCPRDISAALLDYQRRNDSSIVDHEIIIKDDGRQKFKWIRGEITDGPELH
jgi:hypothetical protein